MKKMRGLFRIIFGRTAFVVLFMAIQVGILFGAFRWLEEYMHTVSYTHLDVYKRQGSSQRKQGCPLTG